MKRRKSTDPVTLPKPGEVYRLGDQNVLVLTTECHKDMWGDWWRVTLIEDGLLTTAVWRPGDRWQWMWGMGNAEVEP